MPLGNLYGSRAGLVRSSLFLNVRCFLINARPRVGLLLSCPYLRVIGCEIRAPLLPYKLPRCAYDDVIDDVIMVAKVLSKLLSKLLVTLKR